MADKRIDEKDVFNRARLIAGPEERLGFVQASCGQDPAAMHRLLELLRVYDHERSFLESSPFAGCAIAEPVAERPGTLIGPYKLLEQIGEGGFGVVFMAEQSAPVRRKVALKVLKPGMDTRQVVARFEAERQALAIMDHPNIAKVFDGGATPSGRPYFVMELVKGVPITEFCDQNHQTPRQRLELFIPVCHAVQHAHQKGIIHRDLKPTNVLVSMHDTVPVPKIIDFGIAKAMEQELTDKTSFTGFAQMVGTPLYMSPEQAGQSGLDIDTRSDIYSLGVLLYELLTGTTPFAKERFKEADYDEIRRIVREEEPPRPSTRLSELSSPTRAVATTLDSVAAQRQTEPAKLTKLVKGELDWIVMKALEKDRNRRYETANGLAMDLQRYLRDEPVQACPPSAWYQLRKFARRNKAAVLTVMAVFVALTGGVAGATWGLLRAEHALEAEAIQRKLAEDAAKSERVAKEAEAEQRNRAEIAHKKAVREAAVAAAINDFLNNDLLQMASPVGAAYRGLTPDANLKLRTVLQRAAKRIDGKFVHEPEVEMKIRYTVGYSLHRVGDYAGALAQYQKVVPWFQETLGPDHPETLSAEYRLAVMHKHLGPSAKAVPLLEQSFEKHKAALGLQHPQTLESMHGLATVWWGGKHKEKGLQLFEETLELRKRHLGPAHPDTLVTMNHVAALYLQQMQLEKALPLFEKALAGMQKKFDTVDPERLNATSNLARAYHAAEQIDKAVPLQESVMRQFKTVYGLDDPATQQIIDNLITYHVDSGRCDTAETLLISIQSGGANHPTIGNQRQFVRDFFDPLLQGINRYRILSTKQRQDLREKHHRELIQGVRPAADKYQQELAAKNADHPDTLAARQAFAVVLRTQNRTSAAAYHFKAVLDARQRLSSGEHPDTQACRLELGTIRLQQKRYAEAEPLLLEAYAGLKRHESKGRVTQALERLVQLYNGWDKKDKAKEWRQKLDEQKKP